jgi:hypothetical protein
MQPCQFTGEPVRFGPMSAPDSSTPDLPVPLHFKELHLLPRVIFAMGAIIFVASMIAHDLELTLFGAGAVFAAVAFNFLVVIFKIGYEDQSPRWLREAGLVLDLILAAALGIGCFYLSAHLASCHTIPTYFKLPPPPSTN